MPFIDDRGRLFGLVNLIDLGIAVVVLLLIPLGYGAYMLFRTPTPVITSVEPKILVQGGDLLLKLHGRDFRPFLQAAVERLYMDEFLVASPTEAEVRLSAKLGLGTHDLYLYDSGELLAKVPAAFTIVPPPPPPAPPAYTFATQVVGTFIGLTKTQVDALHTGVKLPETAEVPLAEVLALKSPTPASRKLLVEKILADIPGIDTYQVDAVLRVFCVPNAQSCTVAGANVALNSVLSLPTKGGAVSYKIDDIRPASDPPRFPEAKTVRLLGSFLDVTAARAGRLKPGVTFSEPGRPAIGTIEEVGEPTAAPAPGKYAVPSVIAIKCRLVRESCFLGDQYVEPKSTLTLPQADGAVRFLIQESRDENRPLALPPVGWVRALGVIVDLDRGAADSLVVGTKFMEGAVQPRAELLVRAAPEPYVARLKVADEVFVPATVAQRVQVPAILRIRCSMTMTTCVTADGPLLADANLALSWRGRPAVFVVRAITADVDPQPSEIHVRFIMRPETRPLVKVNQIDTGSRGLSFGPEHSATIAALKADEEISSNGSFDLRDDRRIFAQLPERITAVEGTLRIPLERTPEGWMYRGQVVRSGAILNFETPLYFIRGWILDVPPLAPPTRPATQSAVDPR